MKRIAIVIGYAALLLVFAIAFREGSENFLVRAQNPVPTFVPTVKSCGTTSTCSNTAEITPRIFIGSAQLSSGTPSAVTVTGISPAFTSSSSFVCTVTDATNAPSNLLKCENASASSITITGPNTITDTINFVLVGN